MDDDNKAMELFLKARFSTFNNIMGNWRRKKDKNKSILQLFEKIIEIEK